MQPTSNILLSTDMSREVKARWREMTLVIRDSLDAGARNLALIFFDTSVGSDMMATQLSRHHSLMVTQQREGRIVRHFKTAR